MNNSKWRRPEHFSAGFTLIELMVTIVIIAILAAIALPSYNSYIDRSRARTAGADLVALATALENVFQRQLSYPASGAADTAATMALVTGWQPAEGDNFTYKYSTEATYTLTASRANCTLTLKHNNVRTITGSACGGLTSW